MKILLMLMFIFLTVPVIQAVVIDDFEDGNLSDYTYTIILDDGGGSHNVSAWQIAGGQLQINTTSYSDIEQSAFIKAGYTLSVGQELQADYNSNGGNRAMGLYVGVVPTDGVRQNYITIYAESSTSVLSRGFNGTSEMSLKSSSGNYTKLFIARDGANDYEAGYYVGDVRVVVADRNGLAFGAGDTIAVGFYADVRSSGPIGNADNLGIFSVSMPPTIVSNPGGVTTTLSQSASFEAVFSCLTTPSVEWYKAASPADLLMDPAQANIDVQLTYDSQNDQYTSQLSITGLTTEDAGQYYCKVTNDSGIPAVSTLANLVVYGLVAHWTLDQEQSSDIDSNYVYLEEIAGYDAQVNGTPTFVPGADGAAGHAVQITGGQGAALCPIFDPIKQSGRMTISFWVKWNEAPGTQEDLLAESTSSETLIAPDGLKADGHWHHVCTVYDGITGKLYVDGVLRNQGAWQLPNNTEAAISIGMTNDGQTPFNGAFDDVRLYNYALTDTEVADLRYSLSGERSCILEFDATYDLVPDCVINLDDLAVFAADWITGYDLAEFSDFSSSWQSSGLYPPGI